MALTTDKRRNVVSISSVSNRMGVVRGTTGDIVSEIGLTLSKQLDFFAKRQAELESVKYEADVKSKVYKSIQQYGRDHFSDPAGFTNKTDAYIKTLVDKAPTRFKDWTKSFASMEAAREGEKIFTRKINFDFISTRDLINENVDNLINTFQLDMYGKDLEKVDNYFNTVIAPQIREIEKNYTSLRSSAYPEQLSGLDTTENFIKDIQVKFELAKIINERKHLIDARYDDLITGTEGGESFNIDNVQAILDLENELLDLDNAYLNNPAQQEYQGSASLTFEDFKDDRAAILKEVKTWEKNYINSFADANLKANFIQQTNRDQIISFYSDDLITNPSKHTTTNISDLGVLYNFSSEQVTDLERKKAIGQVIHSSAMLFQPSTLADANVQNLEAVAMKTLQAINKIDSTYMGNSQEDINMIKNMIGREQVKKLLGIDSDEAFPVMSFFEQPSLDANGEQIIDTVTGNPVTQFAPNNALKQVATYAARYNISIPELDNFINGAMNINPTTEEGMIKLKQIAHTAHYLHTRDGFAYNFNNVSKEMLGTLLEYHRISRINTDSITDQDMANWFFKTQNKDNPTRAAISEKIDAYLYSDESNPLIDSLINDIKEKNRPTTTFGVSASYLDTNVPLADCIFNSDAYERTIEIERIEMNAIIKPLLEIYLMGTFQTANEVTPDMINMKSKDFINVITQEMANKGLYVVRGG